MDFVVPLIKSERSNSPLSFAFNAVAMVAMGNRSEANALLPSANDQYSRALRRVNMALRDPAAQKLDATLAAVLLLGLFEVLSGTKSLNTSKLKAVLGVIIRPDYHSLGLAHRRRSNAYQNEG